MELTAIFRVKFHHQNYYKYAVLTLKREGDFLFWYRRMGFWQYISSYDSLKGALAEHPEAVLSYRNIKVDKDDSTREISAPYKESDLKSKPAFYNRKSFWSFLMALSGLSILPIPFIGWYAIFMMIISISIALFTLIGHEIYVWH